MIIKKVEDLKGNEVLARSLMTWDYQVILPEGSVLKREYIDKVLELGILEVYIKADQTTENQITILKTDTEISIKEKVKDILERHTYQNNQELAQLSNTADNIIKNILEEEQIIEKIFDMKERNTDLYEHSITICALAILTALRLNVEKSKIHDIGVSCLLHDIGLRYSTTDFTNKKKDDFTIQEMMEYKKHPVYGYTSLKEERWISELSKKMILYHHETLDGLGFPLKMRELPIESGIVNVCDTFDEMICGIGQQRVKVHEAIEYLKNYKNIKFDSDIVDAFLSFTAVYPAGSQVMTNEGELAIVISQNKEFQNRPVIRILKDKNGNDVREEKIINLVKVHNIFIDKVLD